MVFFQCQNTISYVEDRVIINSQQISLLWILSCVQHKIEPIIGHRKNDWNKSGKGTEEEGGRRFTYLIALIYEWKGMLASQKEVGSGHSTKLSPINNMWNVQIKYDSVQLCNGLILIYDLLCENKQFANKITTIW